MSVLEAHGAAADALVAHSRVLAELVFREVLETLRAGALVTVFALLDSVRDAEAGRTLEVVQELLHRTLGVEVGLGEWQD